MTIAELVDDMILRQRPRKGGAAAARAIGVTKASVSNWRTGKTVPSALILARFAAHLGARLTFTSAEGWGWEPAE